MTEPQQPTPDDSADDAAVRAILALFDEPAPHALIEAVLAPPMIPGLTDRFAGLVPPKGGRGLIARYLPALGRRMGVEPAALDPSVVERWQAAIDRGVASGEIVCEAGRLALRPDVRDAARARQPASGEASARANERIYLLYYAAPEHRLPETTPELQVLGRAVLHACRAGKVQEAYDRVYLARVARGDALYIGLELGLYELWLDIIAPLFTTPFTEVRSELKPEDRAAVLAHAGLALRSLGRFEEAEAAIAASAAETRALGLRLATATATQNLSEVRQVLGDLAGARAAAQESVREAEAGANPFRILSAQCRVADIAHQQGETALARTLFAGAEARQRAINKGLRHLVSLRHYCYADLLLATGEPPVQVLKRGVFALNISNGFLGNGMTPLDVALDLLVLGRAAHALLVRGGDASEVLTADPAEFARSNFDDAVTRLRVPVYIAFLPGALTSRARFAAFEERRADALADLDEAITLARRHGMRLALTDALIERHRLSGDPAARDEAARLAAACGYARAAISIEGPSA